MQTDWYEWDCLAVSLAWGRIEYASLRKCGNVAVNESDQSRTHNDKRYSTYLDNIPNTYGMASKFMCHAKKSKMH